MSWVSRFDPSAIHGDLGKKDYKSIPASSSPLVEEEPMLRFLLRRRKAGYNGGPPLERKISKFHRFATADYGLIRQEQAREIVKALHPLYRRIDRQPGYIKNVEWRESLFMMRRYAQGEKITRKDQRYLLKSFSYKLAQHIAEAGISESALPAELSLENLFTSLRINDSGRSY